MTLLVHPLTEGQPAISTVGSSVTRLVISKVWSLVVSQIAGRYGNVAVHTDHDELAHSVTGLRQPGHCSAPMTIWPSPLRSSHWSKLIHAV